MNVRLELPVLVLVALLLGLTACDPASESSPDAGDGDTESPDTMPGDAEGSDTDSDTASPQPDTTERDAVDVDEMEEPLEPDFDLDFEGFGANAGAGLEQGATSVTVTTLADSGPGSLRDVVSGASGATHVRFEVDGTIDLASYVDVPSKVAIDARDRDVSLTGCGLRLNGVEDVVVLNLAFINIGRSNCGDGIQMLDGTRDVAVSHCLFDNGGMEFVPDIPDEQISVVFGSTDITVEWSRFRNHDKVLLFGNGDAPAAVDAEIRVTLHHNVFESTGRRHPFLRHGKVDMYNNWLRNWTRYLETPYGVRAQAEAEILLQSNYFEQEDLTYTLGAVHLEGGKIRAVDNEISSSRIAIAANDPEEVFERPYAARIDLVGDAWRAMMREYAGDTW